MFYRLLMIFLILISFGCSHIQQKPNLEEFTLNVTIEHLANRDAWRATFRTSQPTSTLVFNRQINKFRLKNWRAITPQISIVEKNGREQIVSTSPFQEVLFEFDSYYESTPKDYEFFQVFSDKSVVMYTGHLNAQSMQSTYRISFYS